MSFSKVNKKKVLFLIPTLCGGGAERVIVTLLKHLDRAKFKLTLAVVDTRNAVFLEHLPKDVELIDLDYRMVRYALPKIIWLIWCRRPDVVFSTLGHLNLALAMVRIFLPDKIRYIARETTVVSYGLHAHRFPRLWRKLIRRYYGRVDLLVCQSRFMQRDLVENFSFPEDRTVVINNPVDMDLIYAKSNQSHELGNKDLGLIYFVAAGRLSSVKGFDLLIEAVAILKDRRIRLDILGEGLLLDDLKQLVRSSELEDQVKFAGFQPNPYAWFSRADGFVLSSRYEGFPNVVLEALACGTPVIATPAPGGVQEILNDIPECSVADEVTAVSLAKAICDWISSARKRVSCSVVEPYEHRRIVGQYEQILHASIARQR